jgi:hypothetical protein
LTLDVISPATPRMSSVALATAPTTLLTSLSKRSAIWRRSALVSSSFFSLSDSSASRSVRASITLRRKTSTACAMVPTSSRRSPPGIATSMSSLDSLFMIAVIETSGREMPRPKNSATRPAAIRIATVPKMRLRCERAAATS